MAQEILINLLRIQRAKLHNLFSGHATTDRILLNVMALCDEYEAMKVIRHQLVFSLLRK